MDAFEVIGAFVDRERVDPEALKDALSSADGRQYLVDLLALRALTTDQVPGDAVTLRQRRLSRRWLTMAAAIALTLAGGYVVGQRSGAALAARSVPSPIFIEVAQPILVPAPTKIIRLEPGVNWKSGGD